MRKIGYSIALLLEIAFYAGAYIFDYFTKKKLGMNRYVVFLNNKIEDTVPIQTIIYGGAAVVAVLMIIAILIYWKKHAQLKKLPGVMLVVSAFTTAFYVYYALVQSIETKRAYYPLCVFFLAAGLIQVLKTLVGCLVCRKENQDEK
ncbi:hypothetical protein [Extibacter muris]|jgi:hypothetical protein|uniref:Uncharacterized protein n=1 Tax=Extibacter muris TaxID=1796622 RepID=A0A4R4FFS1_9FIRM|nr:hypothetical protein [Extibacter muris]MCU0078114.1 hypothetical protein [Extibacter muris]TDA21679.1 hypothetical protein E1963_10080 [Extibacter muris]